jgi:hypothetical protein
VTYPDAIATHNAEQVFFYDADGMQRRVDYAPEVVGRACFVEYSDRQRTFDGLVFPTRWQVYRRVRDGDADRTLATMTLNVRGLTMC